MQFDNSLLLDFLGEVDKKLQRKIRMVAVGGTAMTLLGLKHSTIDIDLNFSGGDIDVFKEALLAVPHGFRIDTYNNGMIFSQQLPADYIDKAVSVKTGFRNIRLLALHPLDIIITKVGRLNERDMQDIEACITKFGIKRIQIEERARLVEYVGRESNYRHNLACVIKRFF